MTEPTCEPDWDDRCDCDCGCRELTDNPYDKYCMDCNIDESGKCEEAIEANIRLVYGDALGDDHD